MDFESSRARKGFQIFAWALLIYNIPVILWGAYVRISFSGDGCGSNWPFCHGQAIPSRMTAPTLIEFTHRIMTSVDVVAAIVLCLWAFWSFPRQHAVRKYALLSLLFLFVEALLGAGLVLLRLVAKDQSAGRATYLAAHLTNTMLLLAALTVTAWLPGTGVSRLRWRTVPGSLLGALGMALLTSVTGAIAALGDTLFPASSLRSGLQQDFSTSTSFLLRLRLFHPAVAVLGAAYFAWAAYRILRQSDEGELRSTAGRVLAITFVQLMAGVMNLSLLAPIWMQLIHLLLANLLWISLILLLLTTIVSIVKESNGDSAPQRLQSALQSAGPFVH